MELTTSHETSLPPKKTLLGLKTIKAKLIFSFGLFTTFVIGIVLVFFWAEQKEDQLKAISKNLQEIGFKAQQASNLEKEFFIEETINPEFYEARNSPYSKQHKDLLVEVVAQLNHLKNQQELKGLGLSKDVENLEREINSLQLIFDSLVVTLLDRGFKSYGAEGDMRRAYGSISNSGYNLDQVKLLSIRRSEKDYIIRKDERYIDMVETAIKDLKKEVDASVTDYYGKVFLEGALNKYVTAFRKIVVLDEQVGFHGKPGLRHQLGALSERIEGQVSEVEVKVNARSEEIKAELEYILGALLVVFVALVITLGSYIGKSLSSPVRKLSASIHQVVEKGFDTKFDHQVSAREDEVGVLSRDFVYLVDHVRQRNKEVIQQKEEITKAYNNIKLVRKIGQEINAQLTVQSIAQVLFKEIDSLLEVDALLVGLVNQENKVINFWGVDRRKGRIAPFSRSLQENNRIGVWCYNIQERIISNDFEAELKGKFKHFSPTLEAENHGSVAYLPLSSKKTNLGILYLQADKKNAYREVETNLMISLVTYMVGALENALIYENLEEAVRERTAEVVEQKKEIESQKAAVEFAFTELERKNEQLTSSINYAKRIQESILPEPERLNELLPESFVFFKPRDIVSGDFYWFHQVGQKIIIAAVDCTGHGVPGAFMSMIGYRILDDIVLNLGITSPDRILEEMHLQIRSSLKQNESNNQDGMDAGICTIDLQNGKLFFAGAKNPMIFVNLENEELPDMALIKADKFSVGGKENRKEEEGRRQYTLTTLDLRNEQIDNAMVYLFSDGYQDQFGGAENRKFMTKRFRNLLWANSTKPAYQQKNILDKTLTKWIGSEQKQTDDILVIGFRLEKPIFASAEPKKAKKTVPA